MSLNNSTTLRRVFSRPAALLAGTALAMSAGVVQAQETISLPVPSQAAGPVCAPVSDAGANTIQLKRTFFEDFNSLDLTKKWTPHYDGGYDLASKTWQGYDWVVKRTQPGAREQQIYVDPNYRGKASRPLGLNPFTVQNGILTITADRIADQNRDALAGFEFTSGLLTSRKSFTQKYGYFETRAKVPAGPNLVPAFWMLADDRTYPQELDVMEAPGHAPDKDKIVQTIHWEDANKQKKSSGCRTLLPSFEKDFHYYGALWTPERIVYYLDRKPVGQIQTPSSFVFPMYMMVNLAIGGAWVGDAGPDRPMPVKFDVDNISAYGMSSAPACTVLSNGVLQCQGNGGIQQQGGCFAPGTARCWRESMASRELNSSLIIPAAVPDGRDTDAWKKFWVLLFVMSVIQFSGAWIYPPNKFGGVETLITEKALGVPFQYCLWLFLLFGFGLHVYRAGFDYAARVFAPWAPFVVVALLASTFGISPFSSFRVLLLWVFCAMGAYVTAVELNSSSANKVMFRTLAALVVLSTFLAVVIPPMGTQSGGTIWRGIFSNKNQMGWIAALVLLVVAGMTTRVRWRVSAFIMLLAVVCLFKSGSKGALVACLVTLAYLSLVSALRSRVTPALGVTAVVLALFSLLMMGLFVLPALLALLGKDPTLTGRTFVWSMYFGSMVNTPFLGEGPGAYTYLSELTAPLAMRLVDLGAIVTPHNAFLGAFGDGGVFGLMAFAGVLIYLGVVAPFLRADRATLICAGVAFLNIAHGMVETHEVFTAGFGWFLMIFFRTLSLRQPEQQAGQEPGAQRPAAPVAGRAGR